VVWLHFGSLSRTMFLPRVGSPFKTLAIGKPALSSVLLCMILLWRHPEANYAKHGLDLWLKLLRLASLISKSI